MGILAWWQGANIGATLKNISPLYLFAALVWYLSSQLISALKWQQLLHAASPAGSTPDGSTPGLPPTTDHRPLTTDHRLSFWECYRFYLIGMFCNLWLPTSIGGDAVRAALAGKRCNDFALAASSIFVERLTGFCALVAIGVFGLLIFFGVNGNANTGNPRAVVIAIIALLIICAIALSLWALRHLTLRLSMRPQVSTFSKKFLKLFRVLDIYFAPQNRPALLSALLLSFLFQGNQIALNIFLANAVGLKLPLDIFIWLVPSLAIASMLPLGIGGLGVREASALALLNGALPAALSPEPAKIIAWSLLWQATLWLSGLPGALVYSGSGFRVQSSGSTTLNSEP